MWHIIGLAIFLICLKLQLYPIYSVKSLHPYNKAEMPLPTKMKKRIGLKNAITSITCVVN